MASVVVANAPEGVDQAVPRRADGSLYRYEMIFGGFAARVYADSVTELCDHLIPGYAELDEDVAQAAARIEYAVRAQVQLQADILVQHGMEGCTSAERELLLGSRHEPPMVGECSPMCPWCSWTSTTNPSRYDVIWRATKSGRLHCHINHHLRSYGADDCGGGFLNALRVGRTQRRFWDERHSQPSRYFWERSPMRQRSGW